MYIRDLQEGQTFSGFFLVAQKQLQPFAKKPGNFLSLVLQDRSGTVQAKVWDNAEFVAQNFAVGDVVDITAAVGSYKGEPQLTVSELRRAVEGTYRWEDLVPTTSRSVAEMKRSVQAMVKAVGDPYLRQLLSVFFGEKDLLEQFATAPAAKGMHQAYRGGLIEHTLNVWELAKTAAALHPEFVDRDLLAAGVLLHDIGKIKEYSYRGVIELTDEGKLLGHILIGTNWVQDAIAKIPGFPTEMASQLLHMIISHHGRLEYGSPKRPQTVAACVLHQADMMDSQIAHYAELAATAAESGSSWSAYDRAVEGAVFIGKEATGDQVAAAEDNYFDFWLEETAKE